MYNVSTHSFSDYEHIVHGELQEKITTLTTQIDSLPVDNRQMKLDLQCRSMHDNLILSGIPEAMQDNPGGSSQTMYALCFKTTYENR